MTGKKGYEKNKRKVPVVLDSGDILDSKFGQLIKKRPRADRRVESREQTDNFVRIGLSIWVTKRPVARASWRQPSLWA